MENTFPSIKKAKEDSTIESKTAKGKTQSSPLFGMD